MLAVRRPGYGARPMERDDSAHANMRELRGYRGQWARPTDRDREATKAVGIIAHQANRREQVMEKELTNEELALWCEEMCIMFAELASWSSSAKRVEMGSKTFTIVAERLRNPPDSSRVRETAKEPPEGGYGVRVLAFDRRCQQWREADVGCIRGTEGRLPGKGYYTHWMPLPPAPKEASDVG